MAVGVIVRGDGARRDGDGDAERAAMLMASAGTFGDAALGDWPLGDAVVTGLCAAAAARAAATGKL